MEEDAQDGSPDSEQTPVGDDRTEQQSAAEVQPLIAQLGQGQDNKINTTGKHRSQAHSQYQDLISLDESYL